MDCAARRALDGLSSTVRQVCKVAFQLVVGGKRDLQLRLHLFTRVDQPEKLATDANLFLLVNHTGFGGG